MKAYRRKTPTVKAFQYKEGMRSKEIQRLLGEDIVFFIDRASRLCIDVHEDEFVLRVDTQNWVVVDSVGVITAHSGLDFQRNYEEVED